MCLPGRHLQPRLLGPAHRRASRIQLRRVRHRARLRRRDDRPAGYGRKLASRQEISVSTTSPPRSRMPSPRCPTATGNHASPGGAGAFPRRLPGDHPAGAVLQLRRTGPARVHQPTRRAAEPGPAFIGPVGNPAGTRRLAREILSALPNLTSRARASTCRAGFTFPTSPPTSWRRTASSQIDGAARVRHCHDPRRRRRTRRADRRSRVGRVRRRRRLAGSPRRGRAVSQLPRTSPHWSWPTARTATTWRRVGTGCGGACSTGPRP